MRRFPELLLAATLGVGLWAAHANAQDKHVTTINQCTVIDSPGAYQVGKVIVATEKDLVPGPGGSVPVCILITSNFVTLDLGGNAIIGPGVPSFGVATFGNNVVNVHSGTVTNFGTGVRLIGADQTVEHVNASYNRDGGITINRAPGTPDAGNRVVNNTANRNGQFGIAVQCPSVVLGNVANRNGTGPTFDIFADAATCTRSHNSPREGDLP